MGGRGGWVGGCLAAWLAMVHMWVGGRVGGWVVMAHNP